MPTNKRRIGSLDSNSSVASSSSQRLGSNQRDGGITGAGYEYATTAAVTTSYSKHLSDVCAVVIHCPKHNKFALMQCAGHKGLWLPYVALKQSEGWYAAIVNRLRHLLNVKLGTKSSTVFTAPEIMHIMRIQLPEVLKYVTRVVFMTNLQSVACLSPSAANSAALRSADGGGVGGGLLRQRGSSSSNTPPATQTGGGGGGNFKCFCDSKESPHGMRWLKHETIVQEEDSLDIWGPEPGIFTSAFAGASVERGAYSEYTLREALRYQGSRETPRNYQEEMLKSCRFEQADILRLYSDYVQHCFPSQNMNYVSFRDYLLKIGYEELSPNLMSAGGLTEGAGGGAGKHGSGSGHSKSHEDAQTLSTVAAGGGQGGGGGGQSGSLQQLQYQQTAQAAGVGSGSGSGLNMHDFRALYRAFKFNKLPYLTFHELLLGLAAMDRSTAHGGHSGELRCGYIFRYYDSNSDNHLQVGELRVMAADRIRAANIKQVQHHANNNNNNQHSNQQEPANQQQQQQDTQQQPQRSSSKRSSGSRSVSSSARSLAAAAAQQHVDSESISKELGKIYQMLNVKQGESISELSFMLAVGSLQLRGTSNLFRSLTSVLPVRQHYETISERHALTDIEGNLVGTELQRKGTCPRCKEKRYSLALHTVKMTHDAQIVEPTEVRFDEYPPPISRAARQVSRATFASDSTPNKMIDMISNYWNAVAAAQANESGSAGGAGSGGGLTGAVAAASGGVRGVTAQALNALSLRMLLGSVNAVALGKTSWERIDRQQLAEDIRRVCSQAEAIFRREARVVPVTSPCFVLGDIHGNLTDLRTYERILWPNAPACVAGSYLFLGDYVDRGDFGLECICYLLSMKILAPTTFYLLRGNHELRSIQQAFTFFREVCEKFRNQQLGIHVWETLNKVFDVMPVAATIDDQIFCAHGGIPTSALRIDELYNIPSPLPDPENQSAAAWEILWNDPVSSTEYAEYSDLLRKQPGGQQAVANMQGYLPNTKRGTAFFFSEEAVKRFLHVNKMTHIIRAHECVPPGYALHCNGKVITIFSSSHYCGATNDAACILIEREKIRIIKLDTD